jgi:hypothetical protein
MTTLENANDGIPDDAPQEKLEWVTPEVTLMATTETDGKQANTNESVSIGLDFGPS